VWFSIKGATSEGGLKLPIVVGPCREGGGYRGGVVLWLEIIETGRPGGVGGRGKISISERFSGSPNT